MFLHPGVLCTAMWTILGQASTTTYPAFHISQASHSTCNPEILAFDAIALRCFVPTRLGVVQGKWDRVLVPNECYNLHQIARNACRHAPINRDSLQQGLFATYLIAGCVRLGSESSSAGAGVWKSGNKNKSRTNICHT